METQRELVDVSVCIPVYNEKDGLRETILEIQGAMEELSYSFEIIVVDDGSTDGSLDTIRDLDLRIIRHGRNLGGGVARLTGIRYARGKIVLQSDADWTYPCDKVHEILERMKSAKMVIGARQRESARNYRWLRILVKWCLKKLASILVHKDIPDLNSGMRAYDRDLALKYAYIYPSGHSIMSTMTLAFLTGGHTVDFVEIAYRERKGESSFQPTIDTYNYLVTIIRTVIYFEPLRLLLPVTGVIGLLAVASTIRDLFLGNVGDLTPLLWVSCLLVFLIAVLSDQFSRISRQISFLKDDHLSRENIYEENR